MLYEEFSYILIALSLLTLEMIRRRETGHEYIRIGNCATYVAVTRCHSYSPGNLQTASLVYLRIRKGGNNRYKQKYNLKKVREYNKDKSRRQIISIKGEEIQVHRT